MSMGDVVDLLDYWREYPPVHLILRAVHLSPAKGSGWARSTAEEHRNASRPEDGEGETFQKMIELQMLCGSALGPQREMPAHIKAMADYAEEVTAKLAGKH